MEKSRVFVVDYAYGFHADTCEVDYVCKLRSQAALRALKKYPNAYVVLGAGMKETTGNCGPLAEMIRSFLVEHHVPESKILLNPYGDNTLTETEAAYQMIQKYGDGKIVCATSAFHAPRVWCIWLLRFGIMPEIYVTKLKPASSEYSKEFIKLPRDILRIILRWSE